MFPKETKRRKAPKFRTHLNSAIPSMHSPCTQMFSSQSFIFSWNFQVLIISAHQKQWHFMLNHLISPKTYTSHQMVKRKAQRDRNFRTFLQTSIHKNALFRCSAFYSRDNYSAYVRNKYSWITQVWEFSGKSSLCRNDVWGIACFVISQNVQCWIWSSHV